MLTRLLVLAHAKLVFSRRACVLGDMIRELLPPNVRVLVA
jgi:hypothetical protein